MSDVAVRKHCVKHDIPTPPLGYWAKLAHGKVVRRPPLPIKERSADELVDLVPRVPKMVSQEAEAAKRGAESNRIDLEAQLRVPSELPQKPHPLVRSIRAVLRKTKADAEGFVTTDAESLPSVSIGRDSVDRVLRILQAVLSATEKLGYAFENGSRGLLLVVDGERFAFRIYAIKDRRPHEPTAKEKRDQEWRDRYRTRFSDGSSERKVYRSWDYYPSDRLTLELRDTNRYGWREQALVKRWRDGKSKRLEDDLADALIWLKPAAVLARETRLEIEERERKRAEEAARRERLRERKRKAGQVKEYLDKLAETNACLERLDRLIERLSAQTVEHGQAQTRILREAEEYRSVLLKEFEDAAINTYLEKIALYSETENVIPALLEKDPGWSWLG